MWQAIASLEKKFWRLLKAPQKSHFGEQKASTSVLRMMFRSWIDEGFHEGLLQAPLYPLKPDVSIGPRGLPGATPPRAQRNSILRILQRGVDRCLPDSPKLGFRVRVYG